MAYKVIILYQLYMPSYFLGTFAEYPYFGLLNTEVQLSGKKDGTTFLFNADRLLKLVTLLSGYSKSSTLSAVNKVAQQYDGMMLGFDLQK